MTILGHAIGLLTGGGLGTIAHGIFGFLHDRIKAKELDRIERVTLRKASYKNIASDWKHLAAFIVCVGLFMWAHSTGQDDDVIHLVNGLLGAGGTWYFGAMWLGK